MRPKQIAAYNVNETVFKLLKRIIGHRKNLKILNVVCGEGYLEYLVLKNMGPLFFSDNEWYAIDINVKQFKLRELPIKLIEHDANNPLPFPDEFFDIVISVETIEHLKRPWDFLKELARVLKKKGYIILTTPNVVHIYDRIQFLFCGELWYFNNSIRDHIYPILPHILFNLIPELKLKLIRIYCNNYRMKYYRRENKFRVRALKILLSKLLTPFIKNNKYKRLLYFDTLIMLLLKP